MVKEFKCDMNCPQVNGIKPKIAYCCIFCARARINYVKEFNRHLWSEDRGFLGENGCKLSRDEMPKECLEYDCKDKVWMVTNIYCSYLIWRDDKWQAFPQIKGHFVGLASKVNSLTQTIHNNIKKLNEDHGVI